jgi:tRNA C32,U32 (ribose-2'-O)-methylase TrmJ
MRFQFFFTKSRAKSRRVKNTKKRVDLASGKEIALLLEYVSKLADVSNYDSHKKPLLMLATRKILTKSSPNVKDVMLLVSLMRRCKLAIERSSSQLMP